MNIYVSDYLQQRRYNSKRYGLLIESLKNKLAILDNPDIDISFSMSAKYQTLQVIINKTKDTISKFDFIEDTIIETLEDFQFEVHGTEEKRTFYKIEYDD